MNNMLKSLLLVGFLSVSVGAMAEECTHSSKWWPYCNDPANGPDIGTSEHTNSQGHGGSSNR